MFARRRQRFHNYRGGETAGDKDLHRNNSAPRSGPGHSAPSLSTPAKINPHPISPAQGSPESMARSRISSEHHDKAGIISSESGPASRFWVQPQRHHPINTTLTFNLGTSHCAHQSSMGSRYHTTSLPVQRRSTYQAPTLISSSLNRERRSEHQRINGCHKRPIFPLPLALPSKSLGVPRRVPPPQIPCCNNPQFQGQQIMARGVDSIPCVSGRVLVMGCSSAGMSSH